MNKAPLITPKAKINYIDHLKVVLTVLVILHHAAVTYGAPGGWYYSQKSELLGAKLLMTVLVSVNQAFFMGFFFFLSALFIPSSYDKKGPAKFVADRLVRLGIPLLFYSFVLSPFLSFMPYKLTHPDVTYLQYLSGFNGWISFGVLWFVLALLMFTLLYVLYRVITDNRMSPKPIPTVKRILLFAIILGIITYGVRIVSPVGKVIEPLGFQPGHFPQYIAMFILGILASRSNWLNSAGLKMGQQMRTIALCLVFIGFPLFFVVRQWLNYPVEAYSIGGGWQVLWYALWEQLVGFTIVSALICIGKAKWNGHSVFLSTLSRSTFAVYIFHPLVLIALSVLAANWAVDPGIKFLVIAPLAVISSFLLGLILVRIPLVNKII